MENYTIIRILLSVLYFAVWIMIAKLKGKAIWDSFTGDDRILQISELVVIVGVVAHIFLIPADAFWNIEASEKVWYGVNIIILGALGTSTYLKSKETKA